MVMRRVTLQSLTVSASYFGFVALFAFCFAHFQSSQRKGTEKLELILYVQKAFQRCQHMTAVAIVKM